ncbi:MAG: hypothetical protein U0359_16075 [Byssovorax sp.]
MVETLPGADPASPWMVHLERAHRLAHEAARAIGEEIEPSAFLSPAARHLERGVTAMYDAFDGRADRTSALGVAHGRLWDAAILVARAGLARALAALRVACAELIAAEERFPRVALASRPEASLRASTDLLPLHVVARGSIAPSFRAPPLPDPGGDDEPAAALPAPRSFDELAAVVEEATRRAEERLKKRLARALPASPKLPAAAPPEPPPGFTEAPAPALPADAFLRRWARYCFEEIGMLGLQRAPLGGDDWRTSLPIERRLLHAVDAMASLGPVALSSLEPLARDAPAVSPMPVFALSLLGGCLEGRDLLAGAERLLFHFGPADPLAAAPFASAMKLAPNPFVPGLLRSLLASTERGCKAIAVEVLAHRGWLTDAELGALADEEEPRILALALPALASAHHRDLARALDRALAHDDLRLQAAALDAMLVAAHPRAASAARAAAGGPLGDRALLSLALAGTEDDARWLLSRAAASPTAPALEALGWAGLLDAAPLLIERLGAGDEETAPVAAAALERLLGAKLIEPIEVPPEKVEDMLLVDPDPEPPKAGSPLGRQVSRARDLPSDGSPETIEGPTRDPAKWQAYWSAHGRALDPNQRIRRGQPYSPSVSLYELDQLPLSPEDRRRLHRELCAQTGRTVAFDPHDLVVEQEKGISAWGGVVKAMREAPGAWGAKKGAS